MLIHFSGIEHQKAKADEHESRLESHERRLKYQRTMLKQSRRKICTLEQQSQQIEEQRLVTEARSAQLEQITDLLPAAPSATSDGNVYILRVWFTLVKLEERCVCT